MPKPPFPLEKDVRQLQRTQVWRIPGELSFCPWEISPTTTTIPRVIWSVKKAPNCPSELDTVITTVPGGKADSWEDGYRTHSPSGQPSQTRCLSIKVSSMPPNTCTVMWHARSIQPIPNTLKKLTPLYNGYEIAGRYTFIQPHREIQSHELKTEVIELGLTKYMKAHRLKFQLNGTYTFKDGHFNNSNKKSGWGTMFQVELGI